MLKGLTRLHPQRTARIYRVTVNKKITQDLKKRGLIYSSTRPKLIGNGIMALEPDADLWATLNDVVWVASANRPNACLK
jgi:hypothetical protein